MKIVILDGYTENPGDLSWNELEALGELTVYDRTPADKIVERIGDANAVYTNKTPVSRETLGKCPNVKFIGVLATGYNVVDVAAAKEKGIPVCNIPTYGTDAVGQFAIALLLEICHHIGHHNEAVHEGRWEHNDDWCFWDYPLIELAHKTIGVIGFGRIGQATGRIAKALGMRVIAYDSYPNGSGEAIAEYVSLDELLAQSDVIALHCPLFPETEGIVNKANIAKMKTGVIILNNSRGPLIVEQDLADALNSGKVYAAGLDVVSMEPIKGDNPLLTAKNCIITPHISWAPKESRQRLMDIAVDNLRQFLAGKPINVVNK
ncbi:D-2-hydroxyacid dehydrogenase [Marasmitruncus massiliensis]|uniref:D-2-hydroxyacid dehydrogenase n=1 Tax=Marasmitruncus massiliensis TaxID=1944642 RepID=UPI000C79C558|nr:D-2-hydroxyacid dehydrogenase [Marasmitruncus massiliensis]